MSHTVTLVTDTILRFVQINIVNYVQGGEAVTAADSNCTAVGALFLGTVSPAQNSLAVPLFPVLVAGKVKLFTFTSGAPAEIPNTTALNAVLNCLVYVSVL